MSEGKHNEDTILPEPEFSELEGQEVLTVEGGQSVYAESGILSTGGFRECIVVAMYDTETEVGGMHHLVAENMQPDEVTEELQRIRAEVSQFSEPEENNWFVAGGYGGSPDSYDPNSVEMRNSDRAVARRNRVERFMEDLDPVSYIAEWTLGDQIEEAYLDLDRGSFIYPAETESETEFDYMLE